MSVANDLIHDLCISPDHPKVSRTDGHLLIIGIPVQRDGRILPALQNGIRNRLNVLPRLSGQIYAFQRDPILNNVSRRLYRTGNRSALRRRHRHDKERHHHGKCQNDCDHCRCDLSSLLFVYLFTILFARHNPTFLCRSPSAALLSHRFFSINMCD